MYVELQQSPSSSHSKKIIQEIAHADGTDHGVVGLEEEMHNVASGEVRGT